MNKFLKLNLQFFAANTGMSFQTKEGVQLTVSEFLEYKKLQKEQEVKTNRPFVGTGSGGTKSIGEQFVESDIYKNFLQKGGATSEVFKFERKALVTSRDVNGDLMGNFPIIGGDAERGFTMRDLLSVGQTQSSAVDYLEETSFTNAAAVAPEGTLKPESSMVFENKTALVKTLAHHIPATKQIIADAPSMQAHINSRLTYGLKLTEESQLLFGDGVGENIQGVMNAGVQTYTANIGETEPDSIRRAMTMVFNSEYAPSGIVISPSDWETVEMLKDTNGQYLLNSVNSGGEKRLFGVPLVVTSAMPAGSFLVGNFKLGAQIFDREDVQVLIATTHADDFTRNQIRILVEERLAFAVYRPLAFVKGTFAV